MSEQMLDQDSIVRRLQARAAKARQDDDPDTAKACEGIVQIMIVAYKKQQRGLPIERVARELQDSLGKLNATEAQIKLLTQIHYVDVG